MKIYLLLILFLLGRPLLACTETSFQVTITEASEPESFVVGVKALWPKSNQPTPGVFFLPPIVGETAIDRSLAKRLCQNGVTGLILNVVKEISEKEATTDLTIHDDSYIRASRGVRAVIEYLENEPRLNGHYGILGMSLGGMIAAYVAGTEPLIKASVIIVGAGNVPGVLSYSDQELVVAQRESRKKFFNVSSQAEYEELLNKFILKDPILVARNILPGSSYLFIAQNDTTVPTRYQRELALAMRDPLIYEMRGGHLSGIIKAGTLHSKKIINFFKRKLLN